MSTYGCQHPLFGRLTLLGGPFFFDPFQLLDWVDNYTE